MRRKGKVFSKPFAQVALAIIRIYSDERSFHWFSTKQVHQIERWLIGGK